MAPYQVTMHVIQYNSSIILESYIILIGRRKLQFDILGASNLDISQIYNILENGDLNLGLHNYSNIMPVT